MFNVPQFMQAMHSFSVFELLIADEPSILHGNPLTDRKSTFQAHVAQVYSKEEVSLVLCSVVL